MCEHYFHELQYKLPRMSEEEAFSTFLTGLTPHIQEKVGVVMCVPFGRPASRWQRPGRHNWAVMVELTFLYI